MWHDHVNNVRHYFRELEWGSGEGDQQEMVNQKLKATILTKEYRINSPSDWP